MPDSKEAIEQARADIAAQLQETYLPAIVQIQQIIEAAGIQAAYDFLAQTLAAEAKGGILTHDKKRRRTPGGAFFFIARGHLPAEVNQRLWPDSKVNQSRPWARTPDTAVRQEQPQPARARKTKNKPLTPHFPWDTREELAGPALAEKGAATTVKITLVGRPGKVIERGDAVILTMTGSKPPALPKGLPTLPETAVTVFLVYVARKQWQKVAAALENPEDKLIIEGYPFMDAKLNVIGVLTQNANTALLQRAAKSDREAKPGASAA